MVQDHESKLRKQLNINTEYITGYLTMVPVVIVLFLTVVIPTSYAIWAGFHAIPALNPEWVWIGISNYTTIFTSTNFYNALRNGFIFTLGSLLLQMILGLGVALLLNQARNKLLTSLSISLYLIPTVVIILIFQLMFAEGYGILTNFATGIGFLERGTSVWADGSTAMSVIILVGSYKYAIFVTLMTLPKLRSIPRSEYEAATVIGATTLQRFRDITWPHIHGILALVILLRGVFMFNKFDIVWLTTNGGPGSSTTTLPVYAYKLTFQDLEYGMGSAAAIVMFGIIAIAGFIYLSVFQPEKEIEEANS